MKTRTIILWGGLYVIFVLALGIAAYFLWSKSKEAPAPVALPLSQLQSHASTSNPVEKPVRMKKMVWNGKDNPEFDALMKQRMNQLSKDSFSEWKTPIDFYGLVIDENKQPLSGAKVTWITTTTNGNGHGDTISGSDGRFSIHTVGKVMDMDVRKEGYCPLTGHQGFEFATFYQENYYDGDEDHPTIFRLHKIPPPEPIYIWEKQLRNANNLIGSQVTFNPRTGQLDSGKGKEGIQIQFVPGPDNGPQREQFNIILTTSGQGVLPLTDQYDGLAPVSGYTNSSDQKTLVDYNGHRFTGTAVFFQDGDGNYGIVRFGVEMLQHELTINYYLLYNPNGGTSLSAPQGSSFQINKR